MGGYYCCPYMKKCVASSKMGCTYPIAGCRPMCYDSKENSKCTCSNKDFPSKWQKKTCTSSPAPAPSTSTSSQDAEYCAKFVPILGCKSKLDNGEQLSTKCSSLCKEKTSQEPRTHTPTTLSKMTPTVAAE